MTSEPTPTAKQIAEWMSEQFKQDCYLYQETVVYEIAEKFGEEFTYDNQNGNLAIRKDVLSVFRTLTEGSVIWERGERRWRKREPGR
jgi:hypothetical protein